MLNLVSKFTPEASVEADDAGLTMVEYAVAGALITAAAAAAFLALGGAVTTKIDEITTAITLIPHRQGEGFGPPLEMGPTMARTLRTLRSRNDDGLAMVEFAIVGSLLMVLLFGIISRLGLLISAHTQAADEARFRCSHQGDQPARLATMPSGS